MFIDRRSTLRDPTTPTPPGKFFEPETWYLDIYKCCVVEKYIVVTRMCMHVSFITHEIIFSNTNEYDNQVYEYNGTKIEE